jgi:uncharacterized protein YigA (DUF484 family)
MRFHRWQCDFTARNAILQLATRFHRWQRDFTAGNAILPLATRFHRRQSDFTAGNAISNKLRRPTDAASTDKHHCHTSNFSFGDSISPLSSLDTSD